MIENVRPVESLTGVDLMANPVWQFVNRDGSGEMLVRPVGRVPVRSLVGKIVGTQIRLANGTQRWALVGNLDERNPRFTEHFLTISVENAGKWFSLARYHDRDFAVRGPEALSQFLHLKVDEVFPFSFDVRRYATDDSPALVGIVGKEPRERLSRADIIAMAVP
jgi:hypothetical protein